jgi:hypothetical protein
MDKNKWKELKTKFFNECVVDARELKIITMAPHDLFKWFKREIKAREVKSVNNQMLNALKSVEIFLRNQDLSEIGRQVRGKVFEAIQIAEGAGKCGDDLLVNNKE